MWVRDLVVGKTFADVGGLWNTINEKVTVASLAGAREVTMIDLMHNKSHWWDKFDEKCKNEDVVCNNKVSMNVDDLDLLERVGTFDVVHSAGVLYHCPNPIHTLNQFYSITNEYFILGTTRVPSNFDDIRFPIDVPSGGILLSEVLSEKQKQICMEFYGLNKGDIFYDGRIDELIQYKKNTKGIETSPWWYFFTDEYIEHILKICGFNVLEKQYYWKLENSYCAVYYLTEKIK